MVDRKFVIPEDAIRLRSYQIWQEEGCPCGRALAHWLQARTELEAQLRGYSPPRGPSSFAMPRVHISVPPSHRVSAKVKRDVR